MTDFEFQEAFDKLIYERGYLLEYVSAGTVRGGAPRFAALFVEKESAFVAFHAVADAQDVLDEWIPKGYVPKVIDAYIDGSGSDRWVLLLSKINETTEPKPNDDVFLETSCFDARITEFMKANDIPGAGVAIMKQGKIVYAQGYGSRDVPGIGNQAVFRKFNQCTPFRLASVSKPITSLTVLRLVQNGDL